MYEVQCMQIKNIFQPYIYNFNIMTRILYFFFYCKKKQNIRI